MSDIIERIRNRINDAPLPAERLLDEAADEIERLTKMVHHASAQGVTFPPNTLPKIRAAVVVVDPDDGSERLAYDPEAGASLKH